jgi:hypothetical protein
VRGWSAAVNSPDAGAPAATAQVAAPARRKPLEEQGAGWERDNDELLDRHAGHVGEHRSVLVLVVPLELHG